jgi:hypothetical protein
VLLIKVRSLCSSIFSTETHRDAGISSSPIQWQQTTQDCGHIAPSAGTITPALSAAAFNAFIAF